MAEWNFIESPNGFLTGSRERQKHTHKEKKLGLAFFIRQNAMGFFLVQPLGVPHYKNPRAFIRMTQRVHFMSNVRVVFLVLPVD